MKRERILLPPKGWRPYMPVGVRRFVKKRDGFGADQKGVHIDHRPPIQEREWDPVAEDTIPPANDPDFLFALLPAGHGPLTVEDVKRMAKTRRIRKAEDRHAEALARPREERKRPKRTIRSRGFDKTRTRGFDGKVRKKLGKYGRK